MSNGPPTSPVQTPAPAPREAHVALVDPMLPALDRLHAEPGRFAFFQAVRLLYSAHGFDGRGNGARPGPLRFTTPASLSFPTSEVASIDAGDTHTRVCVNFMGLTGPSGVLPRSYTEHMIARKLERDRGAQDFFDLFNHRLVSLFWLAWAKHRPEVGREFGFHNSVLRYLEHVVGLGTPALQARLRPGKRGGSIAKPLPSAAMVYFSGLIAQRPHGERAIAQVVSAVVGAPVQSSGCLGTWQAITRDARTRLGRKHAAALGDGSVLGARYWDRQTTLRLTIGPLDRPLFNTLLPRGPRLADVMELSRFLTGLALDLRVRLLLRADQVPPLRLGARDADRPQLGWNTWLQGRSDPGPANESEFHFSAMGGQSWH